MSRAIRTCARPGCPAPAGATLAFAYGSREAWLLALTEERVPERYDLCTEHADRTRAPSGWDLVDRRPAAPGSDEVAAVTEEHVDEATPSASEAEHAPEDLPPASPQRSTVEILAAVLGRDRFEEQDLDDLDELDERDEVDDPDGLHGADDLEDLDGLEDLDDLDGREDGSGAAVPAAALADASAPAADDAQGRLFVDLSIDPRVRASAW